MHQYLLLFYFKWKREQNTNKVNHSQSQEDFFRINYQFLTVFSSGKNVICKISNRSEGITWFTPELAQNASRPCFQHLSVPSWKPDCQEAWEAVTERISEHFLLGELLYKRRSSVPQFPIACGAPLRRSRIPKLDTLSATSHLAHRNSSSSVKLVSCWKAQASHHTHIQTPRLPQSQHTLGVDTSL